MKNKFLGIDLEKLIFEATQEAVAGVLGNNSELEKQKSKAKDLKPFRKSEVDKGLDEKELFQSPENNLLNPKKSSLPDMTVSTILKLLNKIRAGRSLKDPEFKKEFKDYYDKLNKSEQVAMGAFMLGIERIVNPDKEGKGSEAPDPGSYDISMTADKEKEKEAIVKTNKRDDSPIVVGESANKDSEKILLRRLK